LVAKTDGQIGVVRTGNRKTGPLLESLFLKGWRERERKEQTVQQSARNNRGSGNPHENKK